MFGWYLHCRFLHFKFKCRASNRGCWWKLWLLLSYRSFVNNKKKIQNKHSKSLYPNQKQLINYKKKTVGPLTKAETLLLCFFFLSFHVKYTPYVQRNPGAPTVHQPEKTTTLYHRSIYLSHSSENRTTDTVLPIVHKHPSCIVTSLFQHYHNSLIIFFLHVKRTV